MLGHPRWFAPSPHSHSPAGSGGGVLQLLNRRGRLPSPLAPLGAGRPQQIPAGEQQVQPGSAAGNEAQPEVTKPETARYSEGDDARGRGAGACSGGGKGGGGEGGGGSESGDGGAGGGEGGDGTAAARMVQVAAQQAKPVAEAAEGPAADGSRPQAAKGPRTTPCTVTFPVG